MRNVFTPALDSSLILVLKDLWSAMASGASISLGALLSGFSLLFLFLVAQFVVGIQRLAAKNLSTLQSLLAIGKPEILAMRVKVNCIIEQMLDREEGVDGRLDVSCPSPCASCPARVCVAVKRAFFFPLSPV